MLERGTIGPQSATYNPSPLLQLEPLFEFRYPCDEGVIMGETRASAHIEMIYPWDCTYAAKSDGKKVTDEAKGQGCHRNWGC
jgi:hypothetical protein